MSLNLKTVMENFHLCTHLPIRAFTRTGTELLTIGFEDKDAALFNAHFSLEHILEQAEALDRTYNVSFSLKNGISYTLCLIDKNKPELGMYILGPYTIICDYTQPILFKPEHCMAHIVELLYNIAENTISHVLVSHNETLDKEAIKEKTAELDLDDHYSYHVTKAEIYIEKHYAEAITLDSIANYLGINKSYFCTIFKKVTKQSFCNYTNAIRVDKSKHLLISTDLSILDIALATGFSSSSYFNTVFKKVTGITPLEYRHTHQNLLVG